MATCRSCNAPIEWGTSDTTGKPIPLDLAPSPTGNLSIVNGRVRAYGSDDARVHRERRVSHFATCPDAADWRNR